MTTSGMVWQNRVLYSKLPCNFHKGVMPVAHYPSGPLVLSVPKNTAVNTMRKLIEYAKKNRSMWAVMHWPLTSRWWLVEPTATKGKDRHHQLSG